MPLLPTQSTNTNIQHNPHAHRSLPDRKSVRGENEGILGTDTEQDGGISAERACSAPFPLKIPRRRVHFQDSLLSKSVEPIFCRGESMPIDPPCRSSRPCVGVGHHIKRISLNKSPLTNFFSTALPHNASFAHPINKHQHPTQPPCPSTPLAVAADLVSASGTTSLAMYHYHSPEEPFSTHYFLLKLNLNIQR
jgi:hypothetical protein